MPETKPFLQVALPVPLRTLFDYLPPEPYVDIPIGSRVLVPFRGREIIGVVVLTSEKSATESHKIKRVIRALNPESHLPTELLKLCRWVADYYLYPTGEVIIAAIPPYLRQDKDLPNETAWIHTTEGKGLPQGALKRSPKQQAIHHFLLSNVTCSSEDVKREQFPVSAIKSLAEKGLITKTIYSPHDQPAAQILREPAKQLNAEQQTAVDRIQFHLFSCSLLHGATGSGKTEVYLQLTARALQTGKQALILIPEIGLSPQTVGRFKQRFAVPIVELHSNVSDAQRAKNWLLAKQGKAKIIIGTRLAALSALNNLGIIIIDEEHDNAYKQQDSIRYSARDVSIYRAKLNNIPIVLGSATPSLETLNHALNHRYTHLVLRHRATLAIPPELISVDLRNQHLDAGLSESSIETIKHTLTQGKQALVFLNRRGFAPVQLCHACGWLSECPNCSTTMTLHSKPPRLHCHHCDKKTRININCPACGSQDLDTKGLGTEQIELTLKKRISEYPTLRIDRDSTRSKRTLTESLNTIHTGAPCILIGTQMLAKGHHFSNLNLVVIVDADQGFLNPDFRSMEKTGQLLMQVAGRCGREESQGKVLVQTHRPDHPTLQLLLQGGYTRFARQLLSERKFSSLPPFWHCAVFRAESKRPENAMSLLHFARQKLESRFPPSPKLTTLGPIPSAIEKLQDRYRYQLLVKASHRKDLRETLKYVLTEVEQNALSKRVRWSLDIDPIEMQ